MRRREFITLLGGAAGAWPTVVRGQQPPERIRRVGILVGSAIANSLESRASMAAFVQGLAELGWVEGRNLRLDTFWAVGNPDKVKEYEAELGTLASAVVALAPEVIMTNGTRNLDAMLRATRTIPIVFVNVTDRDSGAFINGEKRPGVNATGFTNFQYSLATDWLDLLKEIAPDVKRVGILRDPGITAGVEQWSIIQAAASSRGLEVIEANLGHEPEIVRAFGAFARTPNSGLIVTTSTLATIHRELIISLAAQHKLPAVYPRRLFVADGGLMSFGADLVDQYRLAAGYVGRILKGEEPANLPVQAPANHELVINLKTAKSLGLSVPPALLDRADEVIK
jgi:putative tryptophan/tyrosine transport system substrate-binding protein